MGSFAPTRLFNVRVKLFYDQNLWKDTILSLLIFEVKSVLMGLQSVLMAT